jgi:hypothetical protein
MLEMQSPTENNKPAVVSTLRLAYTIAETAHVLGVCPKTVYRLISRKLLHPSRGLRYPLVPIWEIVRYLRETSFSETKVDDRSILLLYQALLTTEENSKGA